MIEWTAQAIGDIRHAGRAVMRMPLLAAVVVVSLGAGIGVNTVVFSWIQAVVLKPIPGVRDASGFHLVESRSEAGMHPGWSWREFLDLRERVESFRGLLAFRMVPLYVGEPGQVERTYGLLVSDNYFAALDLRPAAGRFFRSDEVARPGTEPVAVISFDFWQERFAGAADVVGRTLRINARPLTIVGVAPQGFQGTVLRLNFDVWLPATLAPVLLGSRELDDRSVRGYAVMGRLAPDVSRAHAQAAVDEAMSDLARTYPEISRTMRAEVLPFWQAPRGPQRSLAAGLALLQGIMLLLLLAVCGNTANLVLARASARQREIGVRLALGAGRWRVRRLMLAENLVMAAAGTALGVAIAMWGTQALPNLRLSGLPIKFTTDVDGMGFAFAMVLGLGSGLLFGAAPALQLARVDPLQALRSGLRTAGRSRLRNALMGIQVALALAILVVAGLFFRSFLETRDTDPGFRPDGVLLAAYDLTGRAKGTLEPRAFAARILDQLRVLPAVESVAIASSVPLDIHGLPSRVFTVEGRARTDPGFDQALANTVTPGYFATMGIPLRAGVDFAGLDDDAAPPQVIVNEAFVRLYLGRNDMHAALGRRLEARGGRYIIIGVARNSLYNAFGEPPIPIIYFSYRDRPPLGGEIHVRSRPGSETALVPAVRAIVRALDEDLPIYNVRTLTVHIENNLIFRRVPARMFAVLGPLLLMLAAIGIYAVVAYTVSQRTAEVGIRRALGASSGRVVFDLMRQSLVIIGAGALIGWLGAVVVARGLVPSGRIDPAVFTAAPLILISVAVVACWLPARRAARVDPMVALRRD